MRALAAPWLVFFFTLARLPHLLLEKPYFQGFVFESLHYIWINLFSVGGYAVPTAGAELLDAPLAG